MVGMFLACWVALLLAKVATSAYTSCNFSWHKLQLQPAQVELFPAQVALERSTGFWSFHP
jgi:hypothetical protein